MHALLPITAVNILLDAGIHIKLPFKLWYFPEAIGKYVCMHILGCI